MSDPARFVRRAALLRHTTTLLLAVLLFSLTADGQTTTTSSTDGKTTPGMAPGAPAGSYSLSGFENVNIFNGGLNFGLPLLSADGRGGARATSVLTVEQKWRVEHVRYQTPGGWQDLYVPKANWWTGDEGFRYGPGVLVGRMAGESPIWCVSQSYYSKTLTRLTFKAGDGTEYELRDQLTGGQPSTNACNSMSVPTRGAVFTSADGTSMTFVADSSVADQRPVANGPIYLYLSGYLLFKDGTRYRIDAGKVSWLRDRNGNRISFAYDVANRVTTITDSLNRQVTVAYDQAEGGQYGTCDRLTVNGFGGTARHIRVCKSSLGGALRTTQPSDPTTPQTFNTLFPELNGSTSSAFNPTVVGSVWLPDGRRYQLFYNVYGELARVVLPTGGAFEYDWAAGSGSGPASGALGGDSGIYRRVLERRVYADGTTLEGRTTYSRATDYVGRYWQDMGYIEVDRRDGAGELLARTRHYFHGAPSFGGMPTDYARWKEGREFRTEAFAADGTTLLRRVESTWQQPVAGQTWPFTQAETNDSAKTNNPQVTQTLTTLADTNQIAKQTFSYDRHNNRTDVYEYDYGAAAPGAFVRRTHTDYLTTNVVGGTTYDYACDPATTCSNQNINPNVIHLRDLLSRQWVSTDEAGTPANRASLTTYAYDQSGLTDRAGITGLCTTFPNAQCSSANSATYLTRGNLTGLTRYSNAAAETGTVTSTSTYDIAGNVVSATNPRGHTAHVSYADSFCNVNGGCGGTYTPNTYAFQSSATSPVPDPSGQYGSTTALVTTAVYDFWTGLAASTTDANTQTTTFEYNDALDRLTAVIRPTGAGRTDFVYSTPTEADLYVRTLTDLDATRRVESKQYLDGMGRPYRSLQYENQVANTPWITIDTAHDALGRVVRVSLPYRSAGGATPLGAGAWAGKKRSETEYDALSRVTTVTTMPDGAAVKTDYSGDRVLVTDQAGKQRISKTDAPGRLVEVWEVRSSDPSSGTEAVSFPSRPDVPTVAAGYRTTYKFDVLGNLRKVEQGTQSRFFMYDSLSRLIRARNPEQGTHSRLTYTDAHNDALTGNTLWSVAYGYDAAHNLTSRVDARNVETTYAYDNLNRNTTVTYEVLEPAPHIAVTPAVTRTYDGATLGKGRTWKNESWQSARTTVGEYDAAGRPKTYSQQYWAGGAWGAPFTTQQAYNLAGDVASQTYPSGNTTHYRYDVAGRLADSGTEPAFKGNLGDGALRTYASEVRYHELGGMEQERFGTATPVFNKHFYNSRGQLAEVRASTYAITAPGQDGNWNRGAILNVYSALAGWTESREDNNGNLRKQMIFLPHGENPDADGYTQMTQFYAYDELNRLTSVEEKRGSTDFFQTYSYDRWGNRTINAAGTWDTSANWDVPEPQFEQDAANPAYREVPAPSNRLYAPGDGGRLPGQKLMGYDAAGHLTKDVYTGGGTRAYDAEGRMTQAQFLSGQTQTATYTYDADGRRVKRQAGAGAEVWHVYGMEGELLAEYAAGAAPTSPQKEYGYRAGELLITAEAGSGSGGSAPQDVTWQNAVGVSASANSLTKTGGAGWDAGASSTQSISAGDGYLEFTAANVSDRMCGLSQGDSSPHYSEIDFAIYPNAGNYVDVYEGGQIKWGGVVQYQPGDRFRVAVEGGAVKYYKVGAGGALSHLYTSAVAPQYPLRADTSLYTTGAQVAGVTITAGQAAPTLLSQGKPATQSSTDWGGVAARAVDGNTSGAWADGSVSHTGYEAQAWWQVDLQGVQQIGRVDFWLMTECCSAHGDFDVKVSDDGVSWTSYYVAGPVDSGGVTANRTGRYVRVQLRGTEHLALAEVQVWSGTVGGGGGASGGGVRWLVADQLGTPRMVIDASGSLAAVKRHDYLPFGEELPAGAGGRTTGLGYSQVDNVRQKFTSKERDAETMLDYFLARYYSSAHGRFTSPDEFTGGPGELYTFVDDASANPTFYADLRNPQSLNKYQYVYNNPLRYTDPEGHEPSGGQDPRICTVPVPETVGEVISEIVARAAEAVQLEVEAAQAKAAEAARKKAETDRKREELWNDHNYYTVIRKTLPTPEQGRKGASKNDQNRKKGQEKADENEGKQTPPGVKPTPNRTGPDRKKDRTPDGNIDRLKDLTEAQKNSPRTKKPIDNTDKTQQDVDTDLKRIQNLPNTNGRP